MTKLWKDLAVNGHGTCLRPSQTERETAWWGGTMLRPCCFQYSSCKTLPRTSNHLRHAKKENRNEQNWLFHTYDPGIPTSGHFLSRTVTLEWTLGP